MIDDLAPRKDLKMRSSWGKVTTDCGESGECLGKHVATGVIPEE
jgi:hypothetical protein